MVLKMCAEMLEKIGKLEKDFERIVAEMGELRKENAKLREEMGRKDEEFARQIADLNEELAKLRNERQRLILGAEPNNDDRAVGMEDLAGPSNSDFVQNTINNNIVIVNGIGIEIKQESGEVVEDCEIGTNHTNNENPPQIAQQIDNPNQNKANGIIIPQNFVKEEVNEAQELIEERDEEMADQNPQMMESYAKNNGRQKNAQNPSKYRLCHWPGCTYQSEYKRVMEKHFRSHTGKQLPFECPKCELAFAYSTSLKIHDRAAHTGRPYACDQCGHTFKLAYYRDKHVEKQHNLNIQSIKKEA